MLHLAIDNPDEFKAYQNDDWLPMTAYAVVAASPVEAWQSRMDVWRSQAGRARCVGLTLWISSKRSYGRHPALGLRRPGFRRPVLSVFEAHNARAVERGVLGPTELEAVLTLPGSIHQRLAAVLAANPMAPELGFVLSLDAGFMLFPGGRDLPVGQPIADRWVERRGSMALAVSLLEIPHVDYRAAPPARSETPKLLHAETMRPTWRERLWLGG
jgi:hypothetical protein